MSGSRVLVTGGSSGIGDAVVGALLAEGADVSVMDIQKPLRTVEHLPVDFSSPADTERALAALPTFQGLVLCAATGARSPVSDMSASEWTRLLNVNAISAGLCIARVCDQMSTGVGGSVVALGSTVTHSVYLGEAAYRSSKAALKAMIETAAAEYAPRGVRINMVTPGHTRTPLTAGLTADEEERIRLQIPIGRIALPDDIVESVLFLLSSRAAYLVGCELVVDGGLRLRPFTASNPGEVRSPST